MQYNLDSSQCKNLSVSESKEWLLTNGIGGYAMGTPSSINSRRYHGLLIAAVAPPVHRMRLVANIEVFVTVNGQIIGLSANRYPGAIYPDGFLSLESFSVDDYVEWNYRVPGGMLRKRLGIHPSKNVTTLEFTYTGPVEIGLTLRPLISHRSHHEDFSFREGYPEEMELQTGQTLIRHEGVGLTLFHEGAAVNDRRMWYYQVEYNRERDRGLRSNEDLFAPVELTYDLASGQSATLHFALEDEIPGDANVFSTPKKTHDLRQMLTKSASHFIVQTESRTSLIAGYPWFTDWGRDTMISLPGILLATERISEARQLLRDYANSIDGGMIPNRFVENESIPDYNTADATLWFVNAAYKTLVAEWDPEFAKEMMAAFELIFKGHVEGTRFNIRVDLVDGLLHQGSPETQLTWMDAKIGDWVITSRHGKAVEIVGLWINALRIMEWLSLQISPERASEFTKWADLAELNFEAKFWREEFGYFADTIEPDSDALRPNQVIALGLPFVKVNEARAKRALAIVDKELLTPVGLRTLSPNHQDYRGRYEGPMKELDSAYHQGTVWPWLLGSYLSASQRYIGNATELRRILRPLKVSMEEYGLGGIAEVYDADPPHRPNGCPWQSWSIAELLRFLKESE